MWSASVRAKSSPFHLATDRRRFDMNAVIPSLGVVRRLRALLGEPLGRTDETGCPWPTVLARESLTAVMEASVFGDCGVDVMAARGREILLSMVPDLLVPVDPGVLMPGIPCSAPRPRVSHFETLRVAATASLIAGNAEFATYLACAIRLRHEEVGGSRNIESLLALVDLSFVGSVDSDAWFLESQRQLSRYAAFRRPAGSDYLDFQRGSANPVVWTLATMRGLPREPVFIATLIESLPLAAPEWRAYLYLLERLHTGIGDTSRHPGFLMGDLETHEATDRATLQQAIAVARELARVDRLPQGPGRRKYEDLRLGTFRSFATLCFARLLAASPSLAHRREAAQVWSMIANSPVPLCFHEHWFEDEQSPLAEVFDTARFECWDAAIKVLESPEAARKFWLDTQHQWDWHGRSKCRDSLCAQNRHVEHGMRTGALRQRGLDIALRGLSQNCCQQKRRLLGLEPGRSLAWSEAVIEEIREAEFLIAIACCFSEEGISLGAEFGDPKIWEGATDDRNRSAIIHLASLLSGTAGECKVRLANLPRHVAAAAARLQEDGWENGVVSVSAKSVASALRSAAPCAIDAMVNSGEDAPPSIEEWLKYSVRPIDLLRLIDLDSAGSVASWGRSDSLRLHAALKPFMISIEIEDLASAGAVNSGRFDDSSRRCIGRLALVTASLHHSAGDLVQASVWTASAAALLGEPSLLDLAARLAANAGLGPDSCSVEDFPGTSESESERNMLALLSIAAVRRGGRWSWSDVKSIAEMSPLVGKPEILDHAVLEGGLLSRVLRLARVDRRRGHRGNRAGCDSSAFHWMEARKWVAEEIEQHVMCLLAGAAIGIAIGLVSEWMRFAPFWAGLACGLVIGAIADFGMTRETRRLSKERCRTGGPCEVLWRLTDIQANTLDLPCRPWKESRDFFGRKLHKRVECDIESASLLPTLQTPADLFAAIREIGINVFGGYPEEVPE